MRDRLLSRPFIAIMTLLAVGCVRDSSEPGIEGSEPDAAIASDTGTAQGSGDGSSEADMSMTSDATTATDAGDPADCTAVCERLVECAAEACPDASALVLRASCRMSCSNSPDFAAMADQIQACGDLVEFIGQRSPEVGMRCGISSGDPRCDAYGARATECMSEVCPNAEEVGPGISQMFRNICNEQVGLGRWPSDQLEDIEDAPCIRPIIGGTIDFLTRRGASPDSGGLQPLCEMGPQVPGATCDAACQVLDRCIPEDTPDEMGGAFGRYDDCRFICGLFDDPSSESWACVSEVNECGAAFRCFEDPQSAPPPRVAECDDYSGLVADCIVAVCAPGEAIREGIALVARGGCDEEVADGRATAEQIAARTAGQACDDPAVAGYVDYFTNQTVEGSGFLAGVCNGMPQNDVDVCRAACSHLSPCIPEDADRNTAPFREPALCELICATSMDIASDVWSCLSMNEQCQPAFMCFNP